MIYICVKNLFDYNFLRSMSQYFSKKTLLSLALFGLLAYSESTEPKVFKCSPETLDALCSVSNPVTVCAVDDDN